jgi:hypothetical protein
MKYILVCMFALFLLSSTAVFAQVQSGSTTTTVGGGGSDAAGTTQETYGEAIPSRVKTMPLSQALPMANDLLNRKILLTGIVEGYCPHDCWITLMEGDARVSVHTSIDGLPSDLAGREIALYGWFEQATTDAGDAGFRFNAISVRP